MKNKFREKRERIVAVFLLLSICTACGKAQEDHRTVDGEAVLNHSQVSRHIFL